MFFYKTVCVKGQVKVVPLEGQVLYPGGPKISTDLYVRCPKKDRERYAVGDIFYSYSLTSSDKYYCATAIHHLESGSPAEDLYKAFLEASTAAAEKPEDKKTDEASTSEPSEPAVETLKSIIDSDKSLSSPTPSKDLFFVDPDNWTLLVRNIKNHVNTMIIGPTGTGKTSVVKMLCSKLGLDLHVFDMGSMVDPISSLLGVHRLEKGESTFDYAKFTQVIQKPCVILLDELSRAAFSTMNILFPCLDDRRKLSIEIASGKGIREIPVHPEVTFIATANVGAEYTGTNSMDRALINRFFPIELGNIPTKEEVGVLMNRSRISKNEAEGIVKIANNLRSLYNKQEVSICVSIRETLLVSDLVRDGWDLRKSMELVYLPLFEGTKIDGERSTVYKTIASY